MLQALGQLWRYTEERELKSTWKKTRSSTVEKGMKNSYHLQQDLLFDIFVRLPSKSLVRFQCLSKSWNHLITSPFFINTHLNHNTLLSQTQPSLLLTCFLYMGVHSISLATDKKGESLEFEWSLKNEFMNRFDGIASCNGVVCLWDRHRMNNIIFWNPSIRKIFKLAPPASSRRGYGCSNDTVALGFDSKSNDYKVVCITHDYPFNIGSDYQVNVELYSLNAGSWRNIDASSSLRQQQFGLFGGQRNQVFLNGVLYWVINCKANRRNLLLSFDLSSELFDKMMLPEILAKEDIMDLSILVLGKSLAIIQYSHGHSDHCHVWDMKEFGVTESWTKLFTVELQGSFSRVIAFRNNGELWIHNPAELVLYNPYVQESRCLEKLTVQQIRYADSYVESLVLINKSKDAEFQETPDHKSKKDKKRFPGTKQGQGMNPADEHLAELLDAWSVQNSCDGFHEKHFG